MTTNVQEEGASTIGLLEAEAAAVLLRAHGHSMALAATLDEAASSLAMTDLEASQRQLDKLRELQRIVVLRIDVLARRVAEGTP